MKKETLSHPHVVATVTQSADLDFLSSFRTFGFDFLEYRLDNLVDDLDQVRSQLKEAILPALITVRRPKEGGANSLDDASRIRMYRDFLSHAAMIDIETASFQSNSAFLDIAAQAREEKALVVASFHDFSKFPGQDELRSVVESAYQTGADVVKLAVVIETMTGLFQLVELVEEQRKNGRLISAMGMGPLGKLSRLVLARSGSCLNYGYLQTANAPGQWSAEELKRLIAEINSTEK